MAVGEMAMVLNASPKADARGPTSPVAEIPPPVNEQNVVDIGVQETARSTPERCLDNPSEFECPISVKTDWMPNERGSSLPPVCATVLSARGSGRVRGDPRPGRLRIAQCNSNNEDDVLQNAASCEGIISSALGGQRRPGPERRRFARTCPMSTSNPSQNCPTSPNLSQVHGRNGWSLRRKTSNQQRKTRHWPTCSKLATLPIFGTHHSRLVIVQKPHAPTPGYTFTQVADKRNTVGLLANTYGDQGDIGVKVPIRCASRGAYLARRGSAGVRVVTRLRLVTLFSPTLLVGGDARSANVHSNRNTHPNPRFRWASFRVLPARRTASPGLPRPVFS